MTDPSEPSLLERAKRYRELAAHARRDAERTSGAIREGYLMVESGWLALAEDMEGVASREAGHDPMMLAALRSGPKADR